MKIVEQRAELIPHGNDPYKLIEEIARTCYKSEANGDPKGFVIRLKNSKHLAMLEHESIYFKLDKIAMHAFKRYNFEFLKFFNFAYDYVGGSFRAWIELFQNIIERSGSIDEDIIVNQEIYRQLSLVYPDLFTEFVPDYIMEVKYGTVEMLQREKLNSDVLGTMEEHYDEVMFKLLQHSFRFTTSRAIANELVRHRNNVSFAQESQRYVGYDKDKFGNQIEVIKPMFSFDNIDNYQDWHYSMLLAETMYMNMRKRGMQPQFARGVLPNDCKTEIVVTATEEEWQHIINLRYHGTTGAPHPQMKALMELIYKDLVTETEGRVK